MNPSWLAVRPLHNTILYADPPTDLLSPADQTAMITDEMEEFLRRPQQIHITVLEVPVSYQAVLSTVPGLYARPPVFPRPRDPAYAIPPPPANGYDFIFHVGVAGRGPLRIERIGHKNGYRMKDADGEYAPIVHLPKDPIRDTADAELERMERMLVGASLPGPSGPEGPGPAEVMDIPPVPNRGFGKGYENFADELSTEIDVPKLIVHLKESGIDVRVPASHLPARSADGPCSRCTPLWTPVTICAITSSTARSRRHGGMSHHRRSSRSGAPLRRPPRCCSCIVPPSTSRSARNK